MRPKSSSLFYGLAVTAIGILLLVLNGRAELLSWVVMLVGLSIIVPCIYMMAATLSARRQARRDGVSSPASSMADICITITSVLGILLGLWMVFNPGFFIGFLAYAFAILLILYGIWQIVQIGYIYRPQPAGLYVVPVLMIAAGCVILFSSVRTIQYTVVLITGISLICAGINSILSYVAGQRRISA